MSENLKLPGIDLSKAEKYEMLLPQLEALIAPETDLIANISNLMAALKSAMNWLWVGVYFVKEENNWLVLGPFQGPVACTRIGFGRGVCGHAWQNKSIIIVDDVNQFPGHIACSNLSKSEIVLPGFYKNEVAFVLDIDSEEYAAFDKTDELYLSKVVRLIEEKFVQQ